MSLYSISVCLLNISPSIIRVPGLILHEILQSNAAREHMKEMIVFLSLVQGVLRAL